jgi:MarR family transcriptional regulator for hemolysin
MRTSERPDLVRVVQRAMQLTRLVSREIDPYVAEVSQLRHNDFLVLHSLVLGYRSPGAIADRLARSAPSVARALGYLEAEGLVRVDDDPDDRRRRSTHITEAGRVRHELAMRAAAERFDALHPDVDPASVRAAADALDAVWLQIGRDEGYEDDPPRRG